MGVFSAILRLFRGAPIVKPPDQPAMDMSFPETALAVLRAAVWSPAARITVELLSGTPFWEDENYDEFALACMRGGCGRWQDPFHHRLFLITGQRNELVDYDRCAESWVHISKHCPGWPGLRSERTTPDIREQIEEILSEACKLSL